MTARDNVSIDGADAQEDYRYLWIAGVRYARILADAQCEYGCTEAGTYHRPGCGWEVCPIDGWRFNNLSCPHTPLFNPSAAQEDYSFKRIASIVPARISAAARTASQPSRRAAPDLDRARHDLLAATEAAIRADAAYKAAQNVYDAAPYNAPISAPEIVIAFEQAVDTRRAARLHYYDAQDAHRAAFLAAGCPPLGARIGTARLSFTLDGPDAAAGYDPREGGK